MPRKPGQRSKRFEKSVKAIVRDELQEELEEKTAVIGFNDVDIPTASIPNGDVQASANVQKIFPLISQGDGQYNQRIGNEIRLKYLDLKMLLNYADADLSTTDVKNSAVGVRVMILRQKDQNSATGTASDFQGNKLLESGLATAGPSQFTGEALNLCQNINRDQFSVRYDKVHYLDIAYRQSSSGSTAVSQSFFPPKTKVIQKRLTFGKNGLKLTYGDGASNDPTNFPYIMVMGYASTVSSQVPTGNILRYSYSANAVYTDA